MKKIQTFFKKHYLKVLISLLLLAIILFPKLRALYKVQNSSKLVNSDGTKPIDTDFEILNDTYSQADLIAQAIFNLLHQQNVPTIENGKFYDTSSDNFKYPNYQQVLSLLYTNKSIIREIQERFSFHFSKDLLVCFPYFSQSTSINLLKSSFSDVTDFVINTYPTHTTKKTYTYTNGFGGGLQTSYKIIPKVYDIQYTSLGHYYDVFYNQFTPHEDYFNYNKHLAF